MLENGSFKSAKFDVHVCWTEPKLKCEHMTKEDWQNDEKNLILKTPETPETPKETPMEFFFAKYVMALELAEDTENGKDNMPMCNTVPDGMLI
mgnify:CR=1 FL=1